MPWNEQSARARVKDRRKSVHDVEVVDLTRERDFENLQSNVVCRARGVHLYADVSNFHWAVASAGGDKDKQKKLVRQATILRRFQAELAAPFDVVKIQMQAARFHGFCHKPYDSDDESLEAGRVLNAVLCAITLQSYLYDSFNPVFKDEGLGFYRGASGVDSGECLIANIGYRGDRQLICLGTPANVAAKAIGGHGTITVTERVYGLLPTSLQEHFEKAGSVGGFTTYVAVGLKWTDYPELAEEFGVPFDAENLRERTEEKRKARPLSDIDVSRAEVLIDPMALSERRIKRTEAVILYADIDGFTKRVQEAETDGDVVTLVQAFNAIREEFQSCIEVDYPGLSLQHQGDCVLAIVHLPPGDDDHAKRCRKGVDVTIAIQSSMEHVLRKMTDGCDGLHVAVGAAVGHVLVARLGKQGDKEVVCFGPEVTVAQNLQKDSAAQQIRLSEGLYDALTDETLIGQFKKDDVSYVATGLTFPKLNELEDRKAAREGTFAAKASSVSIITSTSGVGRVDRPYHSGE